MRTQELVDPCDGPTCGGICDDCHLTGVLGNAAPLIWEAVGEATLPMDITCAIGMLAGRADTIRSWTIGLCGTGRAAAAGGRGEAAEGLEDPTGAVNEVCPPELPDFAGAASGVAESCIRGDIAANGKPAPVRGELPPRGDRAVATESALLMLRAVPIKLSATCLALSRRPEKGGDHTTP